MGFGKSVLTAIERRNSLAFNRTLRRLKSTDKNSGWRPVVGLEIHAQILSSSKLFSGAGTDFRSPTNRSVALFDAAFPGTLPVLNKRCVEAGALTALALSCDLSQVSTFDRKHYFYSDLPAGYQITQQRAPLAKNGHLKFVVYKGGKDGRLYERTSRIHQIQLEQDSGRSLHDENRSLVDLNRAGLPLMELVFEPDLSDGEEAACLVKELCLLLTRLGTCSCKMEEGALRVDANVSVHKEGTRLGTRTEVKNIGTVRGVANAIDFEIERQINLLNKGQDIINETRSWDAEGFRTVAMRDKEEKQDYRYMPEPNLPPLHLRLNSDQQDDANMVDVLSLKSQVPESPYQMRQRFINDYKISLLQAVRLVNEDLLLPLFVKAMNDKKDRNAIILTDLLLNDILTYINENESTALYFKAEDMGDIADLMHCGSINKTIARKIILELCKGENLSVEEIIEENSLKLISDPKAIEELCQSVVQENEDLVKKHKLGKKQNVVKILEKAVWARTEGRANMEMVKDWFKKKLPPSGK